jgi:hypothetical protein
MSRLRSIVVVAAVFALLFSQLTPMPERQAAAVTPQGPSLTLSTTHVTSPDGAKLSTLLTGRYQNGDKVVNLRSVVSRVERAEYAGPPDILPPIGGTQNATSENAPDAEFYHNDSEMSRSDGTVMVEAAYQYDEASGRNTFSATLNGVTFNVDLDSQQEITPVSDADVDRVNAWLNTEEGQMVQQVGLAIIQEGQNQPENEALLTYYLVAMMVGDDSTTEAALRLPKQRKRSIRTHHASIGPDIRSANSTCSRGSFRSTKTLVAASAPTMQCQGCCGVGCACIPDVFGRPMYATPCSQHDTCSRNYSRLNWRCLPYLWAAMQYVVFVRVSRR